MLERGLVAETQGNVSARDGDEILITPTALAYDAMTTDDVLVLGVEGQRQPSSEWRMHVAIYRARPEVDAIVHTHSPGATAWAHRGEDLSPDVRTAGWARPGSAQLGANAVEALGDRDAALLAEHGVVGVGASLAGALAACERVERLARRAGADRW